MAPRTTRTHYQRTPRRVVRTGGAYRLVPPACGVRGLVRTTTDPDAVTCERCKRAAVAV